MHDFMVNAFYLFIGVLCLSAAAFVIFILAQAFIKEGKEGGKRGGQRKD